MKFVPSKLLPVITILGCLTVIFETRGGALFFDFQDVIKAENKQNARRIPIRILQLSAFSARINVFFIDIFNFLIQ